MAATELRARSDMASRNRSPKTEVLDDGLVPATGNQTALHTAELPSCHVHRNGHLLGHGCRRHAPRLRTCDQVCRVDNKQRIVGGGWSAWSPYPPRAPTPGGRRERQLGTHPRATAIALATAEHLDRGDAFLELTCRGMRAPRTAVAGACGRDGAMPTAPRDRLVHLRLRRRVLPSPPPQLPR